MHKVILEFASFSARNSWAQLLAGCVRRIYQREPWLAASVSDEDYKKLVNEADVKIHPDVAQSPMRETSPD